MVFTAAGERSHFKNRGKGLAESASRNGCRLKTHRTPPPPQCRRPYCGRRDATPSRGDAELPSSHYTSNPSTLILKCLNSRGPACRPVCRGRTVDVAKLRGGRGDCEDLGRWPRPGGVCRRWGRRPAHACAQLALLLTPAPHFFTRQGKQRRMTRQTASSCHPHPQESSVFE